MIDCTRSVTIGDFSTVAGLASQLWTHGYHHFPQGESRFRVDGPIKIGHNVYLGSACMIGAGVRIADRIVVGGHSSVFKNLEQPGMYVSHPLRYVETNIGQVLERLEPVSYSCCEKVYVKRASQ
jgi:acetyltransferase-like isoleucine patch superfamily enzyme